MNRNPLSHLLALSLLLAVASVPGVTVGQELQSLSGRVWVTNRTLNNIALFEAATGTVRGTAPVGRAPTGIVAPPGTGKLYVSDEGSNTVSVLSASSLKLLATIPTGPRPHHMGHDPSGRYVYVAEFGSNQVGMIDTREDRRLMGLAASASPTARTHAPFAAADGTLYAVSEGSNELAAIDPAGGRLLWTMPVGNRPSEVLVTRDGRTAFVSVRNENKVKVVDLSSRAMVGEATVGTQPDTLSLTPDGRALIVGLRGIPAQAAILDTATLKVSWVEVGGTTTGHQWLSEDGRFAFMAVEGPGELGGVAVIDIARGRLRVFYPYPRGGRPHGVYYQPGH